MERNLKTTKVDLNIYNFAATRINQSLLHRISYSFVYTFYTLRTLFIMLKARIKAIIVS